MCKTTVHPLYVDDFGVVSQVALTGLGLGRAGRLGRQLGRRDARDAQRRSPSWLRNQLLGHGRAGAASLP